MVSFISLFGSEKFGWDIERHTIQTNKDGKICDESFPMNKYYKTYREAAREAKKLAIKEGTIFVPENICVITVLMEEGSLVSYQTYANKEPRKVKIVAANIYAAIETVRAEMLPRNAVFIEPH